MAYKQVDERLVPQTQYAAPTTGQTVAVGSNGCVHLTIDPAGSLLNLTLALPANPSDGDIVRFTSSQAITNLSMTGGTIVSAVTSLLLGGKEAYIFNGTSGKWHPFP